MQQSHIHDPPKPIDLPPCPKCGNRMSLARIEPTDTPDFDQRTFECPRCDHSETMMIKFKKIGPSMSRETRVRIINKGPMPMILYQRLRTPIPLSDQTAPTAEQRHSYLE